MVISGRVHNGVVALEGGLTLSEGMQVIVSCPVVPSAELIRHKRRANLPLVASGRPGTLDLTAGRVAEFLDEDNVPA